MRVGRIVVGGPKLLRCHVSQARVVGEVVDKDKNKGSVIKNSWLTAVSPFRHRLSVVLTLAIGIVAGAPEAAFAQIVPAAAVRESVDANVYCYDKAGNRTPAIRTRPARRQRA